MFLTAEAAEKRIASESNLANRVSEMRENDREVIIKGKYDKNEGGKEKLSEEKRELIAVAAHFDTVENVAKEFNVGERTVIRAKAGDRQYWDESKNKAESHIDAERKNRIEEIVEGKKADIVDRALERMLQSINAIDVSGESNKNKSSIARNMSAIVKDLSSVGRSSEGEAGNKVQVVIINPGKKDMKDYDVIDVG